MKKNRLSACATVGCAAVLALALTGCTSDSLSTMMGGNNEQAKAQAANRAYMSSVNQCIDTLNERLDSFEEAVANGDMVSLKTKAAKAGEVVTQLEGITAPDDLADVHAAYVEGCKDLNDALAAYVELYSEAKKGKTDSFEAKLKAIQHKYDQGIAKIKEGDDAAAAKGGANVAADSDKSSEKDAEQKS